MGFDDLEKKLRSIQETQERMNLAIGTSEKFLAATNAIKTLSLPSDIAVAISKFERPLSIATLLTSRSLKDNLMLDGLADSICKIKSISDGRIAAVSAVEMHKQSLEKVSIISASQELINRIQTGVLNHSNTYTSFLSATKSLSDIFLSPVLLQNSERLDKFFSAKNFLEKKPLNAFDFTTGIAFSKALQYYENANLDTLDTDILDLQEKISQDPELQAEVQQIVNIATKEERSHKKIEDLITDLCDPVAEKFGLSQQHTYNFVIFVLWVISFLITMQAKEILLPKSPQGIKYDIHNTIVIQKKTVSCWITKDAPAYLKNYSTSRRLGTVLEETEVEFVKMKDGWCFIKALVAVGKSKKDTVMNCWISQKYVMLLNK